MFVRKKKNPSGLVSVQVIDKSTGRYRVMKTIGSSSDAREVNQLVGQGYKWIANHGGQLPLDLDDEVQQTKAFLEGIDQVTIAGTQRLLGKIYDQIGFDQIPDPLFRTLVISRVCFPASKRKTAEYLKRYHFFDLDPQSIYRYMDRLYSEHKQQVQRISFEHTCSVLGGVIHVVFYDVTTLYFEIDRDDDLRKAGFSKDGKHRHPQVVLGLLVSAGGYPLAYKIFEGNTYEGHTLMRVLDELKEDYNLKDLIVVADSAMLSKANIELLDEGGYRYILGGRIKNEPARTKKKILALRLSHGKSAAIEKSEGTRLIVSYSNKRAKKDQLNRQKGIERLKKRMKSGKLTKSSLNKRGYNKFLELEGDVHVRLDETKITEDERWDGLKGYQTNTDLSNQEVIDNYSQLWKIEKAFRITKHDLKIRPFYHRLPRRIHAHVCISFAAYKVYKELERQLREKKSALSPEQAIEIAKSIYAIQVRTPTTNRIVTKVLYLTEKQKELATLFNL
ncbi:MAG: IS1634 family transposase [Balneolaceae bacterium]